MLESLDRAALGWDMLTRRNMLLGCGSALAAFSLAAGAAPVGRVYSVPVRIASRRLLVDSMIEGQGPFAFGIDTGAVVSMIDFDLANRLNLGKRGKTGLGIAGRSDFYQMFEAREVVFGGAFRQERVLLAGLQGLRLGRDVMGMLAAGCMTSMDSELDFAAMEWRLYPAGGPVRGGWVAHEGAVSPSRIGSPHLFGNATVAGQPMRCLFDTGAPGPALLSPKAARRAGIGLDGQNWSPTQVNGRHSRVYRPSRPLEVGGLVVERPLIRVHDAPAFTDDGIIGLPIMQRLNMATEVGAGRLWTRPNGRSAEPEAYNMSGLWIDRKGELLSAGRVGRGSPAEQAGIARGDRIEGLPFAPLIARLNGIAGSQVPLRVSRGGASRDVLITLADYL
jgi:hypothetical protein